MSRTMTERAVLKPEPKRHENGLMGNGAKSEQGRTSPFGEMGNLSLEIPIALPDLKRVRLVFGRQAFDRVGYAALHELQVVICRTRAFMAGEAEFM